MRKLSARLKAKKAKKPSTIFGHSDFWLDDKFYEKNPRRSTILSAEDEADLYTDDGGEVSATGNFDKIQKLAAVRRAVSNFVSIVAGENLPVIFNGGQDSYTDGKTVVIAADDNPKNFDVMVGLSCHEAAHKLLSDFEHLKAVGNVNHDLSRAHRAVTATGAPRSVAFEWATPSGRFNDPNVPTALLHPFVRSRVEDFGESHDRNEYFEKLQSIYDDLKVIMNIIEDRRIDHYVYNTAQGYRPYYDAMYAKYFYTKEVSKNLRLNPAWRELTIDNYINGLLYFFHPDNDQNALPGLKELIAYVDIPNLSRVSPKGYGAWQRSFKYDDQPPLWKLANEVYAIILRYVELADARSQAPENNDQGGEGAENLSDLPNLDGGFPSPGDMTPSDVQEPNGREKADFDAKAQEKMAKDREKARSVMDGDVKKKKISKKNNEAVQSWDSAQGKTVELNGYGIPKGVEVMVTRKVTKEMLDQEWFIFAGRRWNRSASQAMLDAVAKGKRMGAILHHRLQVRNDPLVTHQTRLSNGKIDKRMLAQLGMENLSVFKKTRIDQHKPAMLHLSIDASGSMHGAKWEKSMATAVALAYVGTKLNNVDVVISIRGGDQIAMVSVVFDSRRDNFTRWTRDIAPFLDCAGATPESLCFHATLDIIMESADTHDVYFINFSDGEPSFRVRTDRNKKASYYNREYFDYSGDVAVKHTRAMMGLMRDRGVKVLSYFISRKSHNGDMYARWTKRGREVFSTMYGDDASFVDVDNVTSVLSTMNTLLQERA